MSTESKLLKTHKLRSTEVRLKILAVFTNSNSAIPKSYFDNFDLDRTTIYRTLKSFEESGIIHRVFDSSENAKYALCTHECQVDEHKDDHIHFECIKCNETNCLTNIQPPNVKIGSNYTVFETNIFLKGICDNCNSA